MPKLLCVLFYVAQFLLSSKLYAYSFEEFAELSLRERSLESVLFNLPIDIRSNYTLAHDPRGGQGGTPQNPRAIMFQPDGKFVITFTGDAASRGYDKLEVMVWRELEKRFEFRSVDFSKTGTPVVSNANDTLCMGCHDPQGKNDPRPIWNEYSGWYGFFGQDDDYIGRRTPGFSTNAGPDSFGRVIDTTNELIELQAFNAMRESHPRYGALIANKNALGIEPYSNVLQSQDYAVRPNLRLTLAFRDLNAQRLHRIASQSPHYSVLKYAAILDHRRVSAKPVTDIIFNQLHISKEDVSLLFPKHVKSFSYYAGRGSMTSSLVDVMLNEIFETRPTSRRLAQSDLSQKLREFYFEASASATVSCEAVVGDPIGSWIKSAIW